jgi:hypothetical protein
LGTLVAIFGIFFSRRKSYQSSDWFPFVGLFQQLTPISQFSRKEQSLSCQLNDSAWKHLYRSRHKRLIYTVIRLHMRSKFQVNNFFKSYFWHFLYMFETFDVINGYFLGKVTFIYFHWLFFILNRGGVRGFFSTSSHKFAK